MGKQGNDSFLQENWRKVTQLLPVRNNPTLQSTTGRARCDEPVGRQDILSGRPAHVTSKMCQLAGQPRWLCYSHELPSRELLDGFYPVPLNGKNSSRTILPFFTV